jgi:chemotaxis protein CheY-P-specific phosphatase CheC/chemotaxis signal transduction protein
MTDEEVYRYIFIPGFSTAKEVTDISGRGVGLDVVKKRVEEMGGDVRLKSTTGLGTVTTITLPLTMAIIPAILLQSGESLFAIPMSSVREVIKLRRHEFKVMRQSTVIQLRDEVISVVELHEVLELGGNGTEAAVRERIMEKQQDDDEIAIVIVDFAGKKIGVGVEKLLGNEEIVIKSLSRHYREVEGLVGASILGNGKIVLILDVEAMVNRYYKEEVSHRSSSDVSADSPKTSFDEAFPLGHVAASTRRPEEGQPGASSSDEPDTRNQTEASESQTVDSDDGAESAVSPDGQEHAKDGENGLLIALGEDKRELLNEIHTSGAVIATMSLTELMGHDIRVSFPTIRMVPIDDIAMDLFGDEEKPVGGIYIGIRGDISGGVLTVLPMKHLLQFSDLLYGRELGTAETVAEEELSGLCEMGNILSASFIRAMADTTGFTILQDAPEISIDMSLPVIDSVLARFNRPGEHILLTEAELYYGEDNQAVCFLLLFLDAGSIDKLLKAASGERSELLEG